MTRSQNDPTKRSNYHDTLIAVQDAVDFVIQHCTALASDVDAITQSTKALDCLRNGCAALLIARANALADKGKLDNAIEDALEATQCQPDSVQGYLVTGDLYSTQGKIQAAIDTYEQGLRTVPPSAWPLLYEKQQAAKMRLTQRFDFVESFPAEIASKIFMQLADECRSAILQCLYTSKHWHEFMLQKCSAIWRTAVVLTGVLDFPHSALLRFLPYTSKYVQQIVLGNVGERNVERITSMAKNISFPSVKSIKIVSSTRMFKQYMSLIALLQNNLTHLHVMMMDTNSNNVDRTPFALDTIILRCRNLESLSMETQAMVTYQPERIPPLDGYHLRELTIITPHIDQPVRDHLLPRCLHLQELSIYDYTPELQHHLELQEPNRWEIKFCSDLPLKKYNNQYTSGLRHLQCMTNDITMQDLTRYLTASQKTLETLEIYKIPETGIGASMFAHLGFCQLTKLSLYVCEQQIQDMSQMINRCQLLEQVMLFLGGARVSDQLSTCLSTLAQLRDLTLSYFRSSTEELERFLATVASRHQKGKLRAITLANCDNVTDEMLSALADITTLHSITLHYISGASATGLAAFMRKLQALPYLKSVDLHTVTDVSDAMIVQLAEIDGLLELGLKSLGEITSDGVRAVADRARTLRSINLYWCQNVDHDASQYLYNKLKCH
ncbi:hypothetical protein BJV82DRAFT_631442 [Fennellomyces sp. T-0311]|nr:hypothetical protein BJV82DRAFT_631442 [Fennellomyces sp. T-0311]